jgi:hypothetical protein
MLRAPPHQRHHLSKTNIPGNRHPRRVRGHARGSESNSQVQRQRAAGHRARVALRAFRSPPFIVHADAHGKALVPPARPGAICCPEKSSMRGRFRAQAIGGFVVWPIFPQPRPGPSELAPERLVPALKPKLYQ